MMKINKEYIKLISTGDAPKPRTSHFQDMLNRHLNQVRNKIQDFPDKSEKPKMSRDTKDSQANLDILKELDEGYFNKANKKKTLAENYSSRFGSGLEERLEKFKPLIESKAKKYGLDPNLLAGLVRQESNFNPYAVSHCGAMGLGQLMPETARSLGVTDPFNAAQNLDGAAKYLSQQLKTFGGNVDKALAAYNAGPGAVMKYGGVPPYSETQNYVRAIRSHVQVISKNDFFEGKGKKV